MANPVIAEHLYTADEFREITRLPENEHRRLELVDGVIIEMPSSSQMNTVIAGLIIYFLNAFVIPRKLGYISGPDGGYRLNDHNVRQPDAAFISAARHSKLENVEFPIAPDLAVEFISPDEDSIDIVKKIQRYIYSGTQIVWTIAPEDKIVCVCTQAAGLNVQDFDMNLCLTLPFASAMRAMGLNVQDFYINAVLDGGAVLPGFTLPVKDIFPA